MTEIGSDALLPDDAQTKIKQALFIDDAYREREQELVEDQPVEDDPGEDFDVLGDT
jgi:hypothetical protein